MKTQLALASLLALLAVGYTADAETKPEWHLRKMEARQQQKEAASQKAAVIQKALKRRKPVTTLTDSRHVYDTAAAKTHSGKFRPTALRCCKLGEKISRKQLSCTLHDYHPEAVSGPGNENRQRPLVTAPNAVRLLMKKLSPKVDRCAQSKYAFNFTKCCTYNQTRAHELEACKRHMRRADRRRCRKAVRKNFP